MESNTKQRKIDSLLVVGRNLEDYSRKWIFIEAFRRNFDTTVIDVRNDRYLLKFVKAIWKEGRGKSHIMIMQVAQAFAGLMPLVWIIATFRRQKIIVDSHISVFDTTVRDRQLAKALSPKGFYYYLQDFITCQLADILVFDTPGHRDYFKRAFHLRKGIAKLVIPVAVNADKIRKAVDSHGKRRNIPEDKFCVMYWGYYIPLQGIEYILGAADILRDQPNLMFVLIGNGQTRKKMEKIKNDLDLKNVLMIDSLDYEELFGYIAEADLCLGIFGKTEKAARVIPNKLLEAMAAGKITVTGENKDMDIFMKDGRDVLFCPLVDSAGLAKRIRDVISNPGLYASIGEGARRTIEDSFSLESQTKLVGGIFSRS